MVEQLAKNGNLPMPRVYIIPSEVPNAFATGRNPSHAAVAVTEGIQRLLTDEELEGVLAHELTQDIYILIYILEIDKYHKHHMLRIEIH